MRFTKRRSQFAHRRQLSAEVFSEIQEVQFALAFHQALAAQESMLSGVKSHFRFTLWRPRSRAPAGVEAVCRHLPFSRHDRSGLFSLRQYSMLACRPCAIVRLAQMAWKWN